MGILSNITGRIFGGGTRKVSARNATAPAMETDSPEEFRLYGHYLQTGKGFARAPRQSIRNKVQNAFVGSASGAMGAGDRTAGKWLPWNSDNPFLTNDFVFKWRQWTMMYETDWASRKIINIPVDDALRKPWVAEGIPEEMAIKIQNRLDQMGFLQVLKRNLKLERLHGGSLGFFGLEDIEDDPSKAYHPRNAEKLRFINSIPISRIARITWDTNPLSEGYMRPEKFSINGHDVHVSRFLVFDGKPLFDPYDFALMQFRANLAGFGPSVLAPIWDDILYAIGTRQAAYQLIQTNNSLIAAIEDLQDLQGTTAGQQAVEKVKEIANMMSLYRAAIIAKDKVELSQHSASFGSVPELILTYIQVLSAASDIPATRFIGQAPGGLNATGESDLENYYNREDAYQHQDIEPHLRRVYDVLGYYYFPNEWPKARESLAFNFPPLWNESEKEQAEKKGLQLDNIIKAVNERLLTDERAIEEMAKLKIFSAKLTPEDLELLAGEREQDEQQQVDPQAEIQKLKNMWPVSDKIRNTEGYADLIRTAGGNPAEFDPDQFARGLAVEQEHFTSTGGDEVEIAKIVLDHLRERSDYYTRPEKVENQIDLPSLPEPTEAQKRAGTYKKHHIRLHGLDISVENPKGSIRRGVGMDGQPWEAKLAGHYGYLKRQSLGADGDPIDIFIGDHEESPIVYLIDQVDPDIGEWDEHKAILGCLCMDEATRLYLDSFSDEKNRIGAISPMSIQDFKGWLKGGETQKPFRAQNSEWNESKIKRDEDGKFSSGRGSGQESSEKESKRSSDHSQTKTVDGKRVAADGSPLPTHIQALKIPPAWTDVSYSNNANADLLAKGKDAKGREQRIYSDDFVARQQSEKHKNVSQLRKTLPEIKNENAAKRKQSPEESDCLSLIMAMGLRPGSERDTKAAKKAYGATTIDGRHVILGEDGSMTLKFTGKKGVELSLPVTDPGLQAMLKKRKEQAGNDGKLFRTDDSKLRAHAHSLDGGKFKPKDFRTALATGNAQNMVESLPSPKSEKEYKKRIIEVAKAVSKKLGNTPAICLRSYIDPSVFSEWRKNL